MHTKRREVTCIIAFHIYTISQCIASLEITRILGTYSFLGPLMIAFALRLFKGYFYLRLILFVNVHNLNHVQQQF
jgi:hypothetical protein